MDGSYSYCFTICGGASLRDKVPFHYQALGVTPQQLLDLPRITPHLKQVMHGLESRHMSTDPYYYLNAAAEPEVRALMKVYYSLPASTRRRLPIEAFCAAAAVDPNVILNCMVAAIARINRLNATVELSAAHPELVRKSIRHAMSNEGEAERALMHRAVGFLPVPKGSQTIIQVTQNSANLPAAIVAPPADATIRRLTNRLNQRQIPEAILVEEADVLTEEGS